MKTKLYDAPVSEVLEITQAAVLCASGEENIEMDFSSLGSEGIVDSGYTINWGK